MAPVLKSGPEAVVKITDKLCDVDGRFVVDREHWFVVACAVFDKDMPLISVTVVNVSCDADIVVSW